MNVVRRSQDWGSITEDAYTIERDSGCRVAVKRVSGYPGFREHAHREADILRKLNHENVLALLGVFNGSDYVDLVLEYMGGGDLLEWLQTSEESEIPVEYSINYLRQVVSSLVYLHSVGICHGDVKAENVYLSRDGMVAKLGDFGLAYDVKTTQEPSTGRRNPHTPPECLQRGPTDTNPPQDPFAADVFSFGVLVFCVLQGKFPWGMAVGDDRQYAAWVRVQRQLMKLDSDRSCVCEHYDGCTSVFLHAEKTGEGAIACGECEKAILEEEEGILAPEWFEMHAEFPVFFRLLVRILSPSPLERPTAETVFSAIFRLSDSEKSPTTRVAEQLGELTLDAGFGKSPVKFSEEENNFDNLHSRGNIYPSDVFDREPSVVETCSLSAEEDEDDYSSQHDFRFDLPTPLVRGLTLEEGLLGSENDSGYSTGTSLNDTEIYPYMERWAKGRKMDNNIGVYRNTEKGVTKEKVCLIGGNGNIYPNKESGIGRRRGLDARRDPVTSRWDLCEEVSGGERDGVGGVGEGCSFGDVVDRGKTGKSMQEVLDDWY